MKTFTYNNELYIRLIPSKSMFHSTMVHEVVNRGDIFAMRVSDQQFTVIPGKAEVEHSEHVMVSSILDIINKDELRKEYRKGFDNGVQVGKQSIKLDLKALKMELCAMTTRVQQMEQGTLPNG